MARLRRAIPSHAARAQRGSPCSLAPMKKILLFSVAALLASASMAGDVSQLFGIVPGQRIETLKRPYPEGGFPSFRVPTADPELRKVFHDAGVTVLPPNIAVSLSSGRAFASLEECFSRLRDVKNVVAGLFPEKPIPPWDGLSKDKALGLSLLCTGSMEAPYFELRLAITHIDAAKRFRKMLNAQGS